jgi:RsiW-degrading membrane proteinase PrsW (M82 family)
MNSFVALILGIIAIILGFFSGLFWLGIFYRMDKYKPEPKSLIALTFFLWCLSVIPAIIFEILFEYFIHPLGDPSVMGSFIAQFLGVGPIEEMSKFLMILAVYWNKEFDEPVDGMVYSTSIALGFATVENIMYMFQSGMIAGLFGLVWTFFLRFFLSTLGHIFFSAMWGYQLGMRKMRLRSGIIIGLVLAAFLHGLYNFVLTQFLYTGILIIPLMITMWLMMRGRMKLALRLSPFRAGEYPEIKCPNCQNIVQYFSSNNCVVCGKEFLEIDSIVARCPNCRSPVQADDVRCSNEKCRMRLIPIIPPSEEKLEEIKEYDVLREYPLVKCPFCGEISQFPGGPFCVICGNEYSISHTLECLCPRCKTKIEHDIEVCPNDKCRMKIKPLIIEEFLSDEMLSEEIKASKFRRPFSNAIVRISDYSGDFKPEIRKLFHFHQYECERMSPIIEGEREWSATEV